MIKKRVISIISIVIIFVLVNSLTTSYADKIRFPRSYKTMADGTIALGPLIVENGESGQEAKVKIIKFDNMGNGKTEFINVSLLKDIPTHVSKFIYAVSADNELILVKENGDNLDILVDLKGNYDVQNIIDAGTSVQDLNEGKYKLIRGKIIDDGRVKIIK